MQELNFPQYSFKIKTVSGRNQIFDEIRKKYVALTPEEWVRQHCIKYLVEEKKYPKGLMAVEMGMKYNRLQKRGDIVMYDNSGRPLLIAECKAPSVKINQETFHQIARYNMALKVKYLFVTNGLEHYCCIMDYEKGSYSFLQKLPDYEFHGKP